MRKVIILYFIEGMTPTKADMVNANKINGSVRFRNASLIDPTGSIEDCDGVAGFIPETYQHLPDPKKANEKVIADELALLEEYKEDPLPVIKTAETIPSIEPTAQQLAAAASAWGTNKVTT